MTCCKYSASDLRETVTFQRATRVPDGVGGWTLTWGAVAGAPTRAMVRQLSGGEVWRFERINAEARLMVVIRYFAGLLESDRVLIRGNAHNITSIGNLDMADRWFEVAVTGGVAT